MSSPELLVKAQVVRECLEQLAAIPQSSYDEFHSDFRNVQSTLHLFQVAIQSLIGVGGLLCARLGLATPRTSFEILELLERDQRVPSGTAVRYAPLIGFRNRIVHLYDRIDERIVHRILVERRSDLVDLLDLLLAIESA